MPLVPCVVFLTALFRKATEGLCLAGAVTPDLWPVSILTRKILLLSGPGMRSPSTCRPVGGRWQP